MAWVTWASSSLAGLLKAAGSPAASSSTPSSCGHRAELEQRVAERTDALRASQARVIQQEKMAAFGLLAAGIAHEVGNPLAALSSLVQMLQRREPDPYTAEKLDLAGRQLARIQRTIRELIDFSRPASHGRHPVPARRGGRGGPGHRQVLPADQAAGDLDRRPGRPAAGPRRPRPPDPGGPQPRPQRRSTPPTTRGGSTSRPGPRTAGVVLSVEDDGRGISLADRCRLFQPFFTTKPHGTGLGLFVSRQIVEELGGTLTYRSEPGQGSTFTSGSPGEPSAADRPRRADRHGRSQARLGPASSRPCPGEPVDAGPRPSR